MKKLTLILSVSILSLSGVYAYTANSEEKSYTFFTSDGWKGNGDKTDYNIGFDSKNKYSGERSIFIEAKTDKVKSDFSTIIQSISAEQFLNKRVRFSGYIKTDNAESVSLWMRVDANDKSLQFDNMYQREVKGSTDWKKYEVVLDVPTESTDIILGGFLAGTGKAWFDNFNVEVVDDTVPSTNIKTHNKEEAKNPNKNFKNLDFED